MIATGRNTDALQSLLSRGADEIVNLTDTDALNNTLQATFERGVDIVLDYLWGPSAEEIIAAATSVAPSDQSIRFIQIGTASAPTITLPGSPLHSSRIELAGSGIGSVSPAAISEILTKLLNAARAARFTLETRAFPLDRVGDAWSIQAATPRIVLTMNQHSR